MFASKNTPSSTPSSTATATPTLTPTGTLTDTEPLTPTVQAQKKLLDGGVALIYENTHGNSTFNFYHVDNLIVYQDFSQFKRNGELDAEGKILWVLVKAEEESKWQLFHVERNEEEESEQNLFHVEPTLHNDMKLSGWRLYTKLLEVTESEEGNAINQQRLILGPQLDLDQPIGCPIALDELDGEPIEESMFLFEDECDVDFSLSGRLLLEKPINGEVQYTLVLFTFDPDSGSGIDGPKNWCRRHRANSPWLCRLIF